MWVASVPAQRCVRVREGGEVLDTVTVDRACFACMLGGEDGRTLDHPKIRDPQVADRWTWLIIACHA